MEENRFHPTQYLNPRISLCCQLSIAVSKTLEMCHSMNISQNKAYEGFGLKIIIFLDCFVLVQPSHLPSIDPLIKNKSGNRFLLGMAGC